MSGKRRKLNRGLDALLGAAAAPAVKSTPSASQSAEEGAVPDGAAKDVLRDLPLEQLTRGKYQPRREFDDAALEELADSIRAQGVMQPIVVRPVAENRWEIIAGERRWRASQRAGLDRIPAVIRDVSDEAAIAMALIENIQRENLNPIEEAEALRRLQQEFELSQGAVAQAVGKSRPVIANLLRLLSLEPAVRELLAQRHLDTGHAKVLLALEGAEQINAAREVVKRKLSVRQTEALVKARLAPPKEPGTRIDPNVDKLQRDLSSRLGASVSINHAKSGKGKLVIEYGDLDQLDGILKRIQ
ncbi:MAG: ParB/RepB/Spo0J family partition protein [Halieaceae bacterium]|jgi:ParB family chromosome partitioning protein|nr:ParB/RepB/Spo0J family partition protein [Halieaceae bacterium]